MTDTAVAPTRTAPAPPRSPYKGLTPYTEEDAAFFFGRSPSGRSSPPTCSQRA
jgi:hypothetical protein